MQCACGCGILIEPHDSRGRPHKYIHGHHNRNPSLATLKKKSESMIGKKNPFYGKHHSEESKQLNREKHLGEKSSVWKGGAQFWLIRSRSKRRNFKFIPLNECDQDGWVGHHLDNEYVIFIPKELHRSVWHSVTKNINMNIINDKVYEWFVNYYGLV